ncbi:MAG TPA: IS701 family transposase [Gemmataceae bacterium]|nr:IS701 family transposase [Gemmataceae bacterium]
MKTYTPDLAPAVLDRLRDYAALFADDFPQAKPARWAGVYLHGLLTDGDRKSVEPLSRRVPLPEGLDSKDPEQALQQFVSQSPWDHEAVLRRYRVRLAATFASPDAVLVIDDTTFPKQGRHSVGVQRQYCGALGKKANCQAAVSVHYVAPRGHYPLALRLFLPESWAADADRLDRAGVPEECRRERAKGQIALDLLDQVRAEGLPGRVVLADAGYGASGDFRRALADRGLHYIAGVTDEVVVFTAPPAWGRPAGRGGVAPVGGRPQTNPQLRPGSPRPVRLREVAARTPLRSVTWRDGTKGGLSGRFAWVRVWPGFGWKRGECAAAAPVWVLIEGRAGGDLKYALSNLPAGTTRLRAVRLWKSRWPVEQGYQQMKEELGLDHFEGRSWRGFHHHAALVMLAYGFLLLERERVRVERERAGGRRTPRKKGSPSGR